LVKFFILHLQDESLQKTIRKIKPPTRTLQDGLS
jgi:hypothetical protein